MAIKDILVHVDSTSACQERVRLAMHLAHRFSAVLTGLFVLPAPEMLAPPEDGAAAALLVTWIADLEDVAAKIGQQFLAKLREDGLDGEWYIKQGEAVRNVIYHARMMDLVVLGQHDPDNPTVLTTPEDVVLSCGRPVLMVPYVGRFDHVGDNAIIAWNGSREAARAMHDSLPLLSADKATVLSVNPILDEEDWRPILMRHLARHGLQAKVEAHVTKELSPAEVVLSDVAFLGGDLVVMGAYGHSRLLETMLGGMTRDMLREMTVPVLMSH